MSVGYSWLSQLGVMSTAAPRVTVAFLTFCIISTFLGSGYLHFLGQVIFFLSGQVSYYLGVWFCHRFFLACLLIIWQDKQRSTQHLIFWWPLLGSIVKAFKVTLTLDLLKFLCLLIGWMTWDESAICTSLDPWQSAHGWFYVVLSRNKFTDYPDKWIWYNIPAQEDYFMSDKFLAPADSNMLNQSN